MINLGKKIQVMFYDKVRNDKSGEKSSGNLSFTLATIFYRKNFCGKGY
jgi:hypothetical protein